MISAIFKFIGLNKAVVVAAGLLLASLAGTGYLLKQSYAENGQLKTDLKYTKASNVAWQKRFVDQKQEYTQAINRLTKREADYQRIEGELNDYQEKLRTILADSNRDDCGVRPSIWMLIKDSAAGNPARSLPGD